MSTWKWNEEPLEFTNEQELEAELQPAELSEEDQHALEVCQEFGY